MTIDQWVGSLGVGLLLLAYALNVSGRLRKDAVAYAGLNAVGAGLACLASLMIGFYPFVVLEGVWMLVSLWALATIRRLS
ncbi:MAG: hypothetical protein KTR20_05490 [Cellvibrionaceae bacterium]|nr:hypothetical protein [Cellvibrionaceae bacterium]